MTTHTVDLIKLPALVRGQGNEYKATGHFKTGSSFDITGAISLSLFGCTQNGGSSGLIISSFFERTHRKTLEVGSHFKLDCKYHWDSTFQNLRTHFLHHLYFVFD